MRIDGGKERFDDLLRKASIVFTDDHIRAFGIGKKDSAHLLSPANKSGGLHAKILPSLPLHVVLVANADNGPAVLCGDFVKNSHCLFWRHFQMDFLSGLDTLLCQPYRVRGHPYRVTRYAIHTTEKHERPA